MELSLTKKIIAQAIKAFNKQGIISTSLRHIAKEVGISDGHLRYYFKTKEDLIVAVYNEMLSRIESIEPAIPKNIPLWNIIILHFERTLTIQTQFSGLFIDSYQLFTKYPRLKKLHREMKKFQKNQFIDENKKNIQKGIFDSSLTEQGLSVIQEQLTILIDYWILYYINESENDLMRDRVIKHFVAISVGLFLPYLNKELQKDIEVWIGENIQENIFEI